MTNRVFIATPTVAGTVTVAFAQTLIAAILAAQKAGWTFRQAFFDGADVTTARNALANVFYEDQSCTHLLFIDSDMGGDGDLFARLFDFGAAFAGIICTERALDLDVLMEEARKGTSRDRATALASRFVVALPPSGGVEFQKGFCKVEALGFGCVLIRRDVFDSLVDKGIVRKTPSGKLKNRGFADEFHDFFSELSRTDGTRLSEDYSFCARAREAGHELWGFGAKAMNHVGSFAYGAAFLDWVKAQAERRSERKETAPPKEPG